MYIGTRVCCLLVGSINSFMSSHIIQFHIYIIYREVHNNNNPYENIIRSSIPPSRNNGDGDSSRKPRANIVYVYIVYIIYISVGIHIYMCTAAKNFSRDDNNNNIMPG